MVDWVCGSLGGSLIPRLHLTTLLRRLGLQTNLYCSDSGYKLRNLFKMATAILRCIPRFFLGQKRSSVVDDGHPHSEKYPLHVICKPNTVITKINAQKTFVINIWLLLRLNRILL